MVLLALMALAAPLANSNQGPLGALLSLDSFATARNQALEDIQSGHVPGERHKLSPADWINSVEHISDPVVKFHQMFPDHPDHLPMRSDDENPEDDTMGQDPNVDGKWDREDPYAAEEAARPFQRGTAARLYR